MAGSVFGGHVRAVNASNLPDTQVPARIRATTLDGRELWRVTLPGSVKQAVADGEGGLIIVRTSSDIRPPDWTWMWDDESIQRLSGENGQTTWEYVQRVRGQISDAATRSDGLIFFVEKRDGDVPSEISTDLVALYQHDGNEAGRWPLGTSSLWGWPYSLNTTPPILLEDGSVAAVAHRFQDDVGQFVLYTLAPNSAVVQQTPIVSDPLPGRFFTAAFNHLMPDGQGGLIAAAGSELYRFDKDGELVAQLVVTNPADTAVGDDAREEVQMVLGEGVAYTLVQRWAGSALPKARLVAFDPVTLAVLGVTENLGGTPNLMLDAALSGGAVAYSVPAEGNSRQLTTGALVGWQGGPSIQLAPVTVIANTAWPYAAGDRSGANAAQAVYVDNTLGTTSVLVKPEKCEDQFDVVLPGSKRLGAIDGIKPPAWLVSGQPAYSQDWYKVINNVGVRINSDGTPTAFAPTFLSISLLLIPDCNFDGNCRSAPGDFLYQHSGGRKLEPEWSQDVPPWHWDWRYPGPSVAVRIQRCAAAK